MFFAFHSKIFDIRRRMKFLKQTEASRNTIETEFYTVITFNHNLLYIHRI